MALKSGIPNTNSRIIALVDMDCFYVQVEQRKNPELRGKPCVVVQYKKWRGGGIIAVSYEARKFGVTRQMRGDDAKEKCPDINLIYVKESRGKADLSLYRQAGAEVIKVLSTFSDSLERASIDEAYIDLGEAVKRIRYYIDGDEKPTIEMNLYMGHGIGFVKEHNEWKLLRKDDPVKDAPWYMKPEDPAVPWGKKRLGHLASGGGLYNTYRVPFQKSIKISFVPKRRGSFWFFVRGVENYPIIIGDIELPKNAELKLYKLENVTMKPFEYALLASTKGRAGMLYQVTMATKSETFGALEACFRAIVDNGNIQYLSSGTEDLFMSAYYYDQGVYHTSHAGLTYKEWPGTMSAYKFFEDDPVLFTNAFKLIWRCGERVDNECFLAKERGCKIENGHTKCTDPEDTAGFSFLDGRINRDLVETVVSTYVWMYEWDTE